MGQYLERSVLILLSAIVWKYGEVFVDDDTEIETHTIKIKHNDVINFEFMQLEIYDDPNDMTTYYRVRKMK